VARLADFTPAPHAVTVVLLKFILASRTIRSALPLIVECIWLHSQRMTTNRHKIILDFSHNRVENLESNDAYDRTRENYQTILVFRIMLSALAGETYRPALFQP
jgi:hypothetical protein